MKKALNKIGWWVFGLMAISIGIYPLLYFIIDRKFGLLASKTEELLLDALWNTGFYTHIILGGLALAIGWVQFSKKIRTQNLKLHRKIGNIYVTAACLSGIASIYIGFYATGGPISAVGFILLGIFWFSTTFMALQYAKKGNIDAHQKMMIYSYAACFAAVTLRIWLPILIAILEDFIPAYRIVAWLCWVPNIIVAFFIIKRIGKTS